MLGSIRSHIVQEDDGTSTGIWGPFALRSAFQPIFTFEADRLSVSAFEALLRPFRGDEQLPPQAFFNSILSSERLFVENLAHTLHLLNAARFLPESAAIFINFDPSVFTDPAVAEATIRDMRVTLVETGIDPHRVVCEVTEKETVSQEALFALVASLRASGFRIAVDDYGADESDMRRIRDLCPDIVKFDADWIARLMETGPGYALLATMVSTFAADGIRTVFEGIEEGWQLELAERPASPWCRVSPWRGHSSCRRISPLSRRRRPPPATQSQLRCPVRPCRAQPGRCARQRPSAAGRSRYERRCGTADQSR